MSFKIGANLGIVLAKGVFISMVCVITILPALILICDKLLTKTAKKEPHIPMNWAAKFSHKFRFALTALFVVFFVGFCRSASGIAASPSQAATPTRIIFRASPKFIIRRKQE